MSNRFKEEMRQRFSREKNWNAIVTKIEEYQLNEETKCISKKRNEKGGKRMKIFMIPAVAAVIAMALFLGNQSTVNPNLKEDPSIIIGNNDPTVELNIAELKIGKFGITTADMDIKLVQLEKIPDEMKWIEELKLPEDMKFSSSYAVYIREDLKENEYNLLHDYIFSYQNGDATRSLKISFSKLEAPLRDCILLDENEKENAEKFSKIGATDLKISHWEEMYMITFEKDGLYFDIETKAMKLEEVVELLKSIVQK